MDETDAKSNGQLSGIYRLVYRVSFLFIAMIFVINIAILLFPPDDYTRMFISDIEAPLIGLGALLALMQAAYRTRKVWPEMARAWLFLSLAQALMVIGDILWAVLELGLDEVPYPSIADVFYLLFYPLLMIAVLWFPVQKQESFGLLKRTLDFFSIILALLAFFWIYIIGPVIESVMRLPYWEKFLGLAYPIGDLIVVGAVSVLVYNRLDRKTGGPIVLILAGLFVMIVTDVIFSIQSIEGTYQSGGIIDLGWVIQYILFWLAALWQIHISHESSNLSKASSNLSDMANTLFSYIPLVGLLAAAGMMYHSSIENLMMSTGVLLIVTIVLWVIVLFRQIVTGLETRRLFRQVDNSLDTVDKQANELEAANRVLELEIAERKRAEERLVFDALHDFLTHLPNRALFIDRLDMAINRTRRLADIPYSVLFLDLDQFKQINDTKGHAAGDELLVLVAKRVSDCVRVNDTVARIGGDEFIILLENAGDDANVFNMAERILDSFKQPFPLAGENIHISVSIGVIVSLTDYENSNDVLRDADIAMYHAKSEGKSRSAIFLPEMRTQTMQRMLIENELRYAIEYSEFRLLYQPLYTLIDHRLVGFEALIRWHNPRMGLVCPDVFIPVAEETGLIIGIGDWVLNEACTQMKKWHKAYPGFDHLSINVNISGRQFAAADFVEKLQNTLKQTGLKPECLKLEITESVLLVGQQMESNLFGSLRDMGVHLQIDDFGTGYSSLSYLQHIPVDVIKIDRSFIQEILHGEKYVELLRAIIRMAHSLGMETTAEGIESEDQRGLLEKMGCNYGQGYLFAKPLDASVVEFELLEVKEHYES
ncbi:MAG: EAL domain-containing protein [Leptolinea sp.]|nr:EAL domain-containing protein [Leptolinea sp.]